MASIPLRSLAAMSKLSGGAIASRRVVEVLCAVVSADRQVSLRAALVATCASSSPVFVVNGDRREIQITPWSLASRWQSPQPDSRGDRRVPVLPQVYPRQKHVASGLSRSLRLILGKMPQLTLQRLDFSFTVHQQMSLLPNNRPSLLILRTLDVMLRLDAFKFEPAPVQDLVCEDGDEDGLEDWPTAVFVEIALLDVSDCGRRVVV